jgi:aminoglycoside phosphotransferase
MAVTKAADLTVSKSPDAAETVAAILADLAGAMTVDSALAASAQRLVRKLARELCELHGLDHEQVMPSVAAASKNGHRDLDGNFIPYEQAHQG